MKKLIYLLSILIGAGLSSCEDPIEVELDKGSTQLNVDAFITNIYGKQTVRLTKTNAYFENKKPTGISDASVKLINKNSGKIYDFVHEQDGNYSWIPMSGDTLAILGNQYALRIVYNGEEYQAESQLNPVPTIDSISYEYRSARGPSPEGYVASLYAMDIFGRADYYWIKTYRNDSLINKPDYINTAVDAAFPPNGGSDGFLFIPPIREGITPFDRPYNLGDKIKVEICSITPETYEFITESRTQMGNGGLFATPPANVRTNIINLTKPERKAVGFFVTSSISSKETQIK